MKKIVSSLLIGAAMVSSAVYAQGAPDNHGQGGPGGQNGAPGGQHGGPGGGNQGGPGGNHGGQGGNHGGQGGNHGGPGGMHADRGGPGMQGGPGSGPGGDWRRRGGRLPNDYRDRQYVVDDWRGYDLQAPPRGYHWVGVGGEYLLVGVASGVIAQIITGH